MPTTTTNRIGTSSLDAAAPVTSVGKPTDAVAQVPRDGTVNSIDSALSVAAGDALRRRVGRDHDYFRLSEEYCRDVARWYDSAELDGLRRRGRALYERFKAETALQYESLVAAGLAIRPWLGEGQPYESSHALRERLRREMTLYVYLTERGHGPEAHHVADRRHPMLELSPYTVDGITLVYNDLFRAVHDLFGHVMHANTFRIDGELRAVKSHLAMYSSEVAPVMLAESAAQICWYYFGPFAEAAAGERPYPDQKVLVMPRKLVRGFWQMFAAPVGCRSYETGRVGSVVFA